jgi:hypothetical protein
MKFKLKKDPKAENNIIKGKKNKEEEKTITKEGVEFIIDDPKNNSLVFWVEKKSENKVWVKISPQMNTSDQTVNVTIGIDEPSH